MCQDNSASWNENVEKNNNPRVFLKGDVQCFFYLELERYGANYMKAVAKTRDTVCLFVCLFVIYTQRTATTPGTSSPTLLE